MTYRIVGGAIARPAPAGEQVSRGRLAFGIVAAPAVWAVQLIANYLFATGACYPKDVPLPEPRGSGVWWIMLAVSVAAPVFGLFVLRVTAARFRCALRDGTAASTMAREEGRTWFLTVCGLMTSAGFLVVILLTSAAFLILPLC